MFFCSLAAARLPLFGSSLLFFLHALRRLNLSTSTSLWSATTSWYVHTEDMQHATNEPGHEPASARSLRQEATSVVSAMPMDVQAKRRSNVERSNVEGCGTNRTCVDATTTNKNRFKLVRLFMVHRAPQSAYCGLYSDSGTRGRASATASVDRHLSTGDALPECELHGGGWKR